jgi:hypothetical protein
MSFSHSPTRHWRTALASALLASVTLISACGGGGAVVGGVGTGGTGAFSSGAIRGLGSIVVNGVRYDDSAATVTDDNGNSSNSSSLKLGVVVEVQGDDIVTPATGLPTSNARSVVFRSEIKGPVTAVNTAAGTLTVLGQSVVISASTVFDLNLPNGLASVAVGQLVEVYGFVDANGVYQATRIEGEDSASAYKLRGKLSALNTTAKTFQIGAAVIDYSAINFSFTLVNGQSIRVELSPTPNTLGQWVATRLNAATALGNGASTAATVEVEGRITAVTSPTRFEINGLVVDASSAGTLPAGLAAGVKVEVKGKLDNGVLVASRVQIEDGGQGSTIEVKGNIAVLDTSAKTFQIRGVLIDYANATFKDGSAANLSVDVRVEVKGSLNASGTVLTATSIEFKGLDDTGIKSGSSSGSSGSSGSGSGSGSGGSSGSDAITSYEVKGSVSALNTTAQTFVVRGVTVSYASASFKDGSVANLANGSVVEVKGTVSNNLLVASQVDFDDESSTGAGGTGSGATSSEFEAKGRITALDTTAQTLVIDGVTITYAGATFKDGSASQLAIGVKVEVKGSRAGDGSVTATRVQFDD